MRCAILILLALLLALLLAPLLAADGQVRLGQLNAANFNSTADQAIPLHYGRYAVRRITVQNCSANLTLAVGGFYTGAAKSGTTIVANTQLYTALTAASKYLDLTLASAVTTDVLTANPIYLSLTTGQGSAATCNVAVFGDVLD